MVEPDVGLVVTEVGLLVLGVGLVVVVVVVVVQPPLHAQIWVKKKFC